MFIKLIKNYLIFFIKLIYIIVENSSRNIENIRNNDSVIDKKEYQSNNRFSISALLIYCVSLKKWSEALLHCCKMKHTISFFAVAILIDGVKKTRITHIKIV